LTRDQRRFAYDLFAADYPFESAQEAGAFMDEVAIAEPVRRAIAIDNAAKYLGLAQPIAA
jgi:predicted TIM-barrel fold metal-dependent hydrolase